MGRATPEAFALAQGLERTFWGDCLNTLEEELKQRVYAKFMGWSAVKEGSRIVDIGGGPVSLLLKTPRVYGTVVDPLPIPEWTVHRYRAAKISYFQMEAEDFTGTGYDEVWIYNVLQHVRDPERVIHVAQRAAPVIRLFEWIDIPPYPGHPHRLTAQGLRQWLKYPRKDGTGVLEDPVSGCYGSYYHTCP